MGFLKSWIYLLFAAGNQKTGGGNESVMNTSACAKRIKGFRGLTWTVEEIFSFDLLKEARN